MTFDIEVKVDDAMLQRLMPTLARLRDAVCAVPKGGASGAAPPWLIDLHRAACEVLSIEVVEDDGHRHEVRT